MKKINLLWLVLLTIPFGISAGMEDDPMLFMTKIDQFEVRNSDGDNPLVFEGQAWIGRDLNKLWVKSEIERVGSETEENELQLLYGRAVAPYWNFQIGWRRDIEPKPDLDWLAVGFQGLAPYYFEIDIALFISDDDQTNLRLEAEYEWMFTQRLVLSPEIEANFFSDDDPERGAGSGLSDVEAGLRLRYEIRREFAPYVGVNWFRKFGDSADFAREEGEDTSDTQLVAGIRAWF